jgi:hypothetical protein
MPPHSTTPKRYQDCKPGFQWYVCSTSAGPQYAGCCSLDPCSFGNSCPLANQQDAVIITTIGAVPTTTVPPSPTGPNPAVIILPTTPGIPAVTTSPATTDSGSSPSVGVIVAASLCSFVGVMVILALWLWLCCLRRRDRGDRRKNDADYSSNASIRGIRGRSPSPFPPPPDDDDSPPSPSPYPPNRPDDGGGVLSRLWDRSATPRSSSSPPASLRRHRRDRTSYSYPDHSGEGVSPMAATYPKMPKPDSMDIRLTPLEVSSSTALFRADLVGVNRTPGRSTSVRRSASETRSGEDRHRTSSKDRRARSSSTRSRQRSRDPWDIKCDTRSRAKFRTDRPRSRVRRSNSTPPPSDISLPRPFKRNNSESQTLVDNSSRAKDRRGGTIKFTYPNHPTLGIRRSLETQGFLNTAKAEYFYHPRKQASVKVTALARLEKPAGRRRTRLDDGEPPSSASDMPPVERSWRSKEYQRADKRNGLFHRPTGQYIRPSKLDGNSGTMVETD